MELSSIVQKVGIELLKSLVSRCIFEVLLREILPERHFEGGKDKTLLIFNVFGTVLEQLFGELIYFLVIRSFYGFAQRFDSLLVALHCIILSL